MLDGDSCAAASEQFGVSKSSAIKWVHLFHRTGSIAPGKMGSHKPVLLNPYRDTLLKQGEHRPPLTLSRLQDLLAGRGVTVSHDTVAVLRLFSPLDLGDIESPAPVLSQDVESRDQFSEIKIKYA